MPAISDDYRWLVSADAEPWLNKVAESEGQGSGQVRQAARLRQDLGAGRAALVLEQVELRRRARTKFPHAERLFFTRRALEQATDATLAAAKAARFPAGPLADLCCGIGGDLMALAQRGPVTGLDRDPLASLLAAANLAAVGAKAGRAVAADATPLAVAEAAAWHIDPDRRPAGARTTTLDFAEPPLETLRRLVDACPHAALKLAPAAEPPADWSAAGERMWLGHRRECQQQVLWLGDLARHRGAHVAWIVEEGDGGWPAPLVGPPGLPIATATHPGRFVHEPQAAVLAANLSGVLAAEHQLRALVPGIAYLTGDRPLATPLAASFAVLDILPLDLKRLKAAVRALRLGPLEIKQRGAGLAPEAVRKQLAPQGDRPAVVLLARQGKRSLAVLAERC